MRFLMTSGILAARRVMRYAAMTGCLSVGLLLTACSDAPDRVSAVGEAFAGPITLHIRQEIGLKSPVVATVKHGDKLEVLSTRRRFMRVRTASNVEGWVDGEKLLTTDQMNKLRVVAEAAAKLPVQGEGTVFEPRNVHTEPHRQSPSFLQLKEEERFYVLAHKLVPREAYKSEISKEIDKAGAPPPKKKTAKTKRGRGGHDNSQVELPPMPPAPKPPENWQELSFRLPTEDTDPPPPKNEEKSGLNLLIRPRAEAPASEEWSLIRVKDGRAGWILTRSIAMTIPEEVSRYAEGHRITSWFALNSVKDGDEVKKQYLWTTISTHRQPYQFDGYRVFVYSLRRHRYETGFREKNVRGYYPSAVHPVEVIEAKKKYTTPGFSVVVEDESGNLIRKTYSFQGYRTILVSITPWNKLEDPLDLNALEISKPTTEPQAARREPDFWDKLKQMLPWTKKG
jgi:uncharacterized protein YgiM (DUF1202 family)